MCGGKKGNRRHTTLSLLNADAKALCLRPDPELVKVFGIPRRRRSVESCPSARADGVSVAPHRPAAAPINGVTTLTDMSNVPPMRSAERIASS